MATLLGYAPAMAGDAPPGPMTNTCTAGYKDGGGTQMPALTASATITVLQGYVLTVTKSVSKNNPTPGDVITYTIKVGNAGASGMTDVTVTDDIGSLLGISALVDPSLTLNGAPLSPESSYISGSVLTVPVGSLAANAAATVAFEVKVDTPTSHAQAVSLSGASASNIAQASATGIPPVDSAPVGITVFSPVINTTKTVSKATANPGDTVTFTITAQNAGNGPAKNVVIKDDLSALPFTYKAGTLKLNGQLQPNPSGSLIQLNINSIAAGATYSVTFDATVN